MPIHAKKNAQKRTQRHRSFNSPVPSLPVDNRMQGPCEDMLTTAYNNPADVKTGRQSPRGGA